MEQQSSRIDALYLGDEGPRAGKGGYQGEQLARALGWFSLGLGLAQLAAPREVARWIGVPDDEATRRALLLVGVREFVSGAGILTQQNPAPWLWLRASGDVMDLALLSAALRSERSDPQRVKTAMTAVLGIAALDAGLGTQLNTAPDEPSRATQERARDVVHAITINRPTAEVYAFWHDFENLPRFMQHLESVRVIDAGRSHWVANGPAGTTVEWDAEIVEERPNELIAWRSLAGADLQHAGTVRFQPAPGKRGTEVQVQLDYQPPVGALGTAVAWLFGEAPGQQVAADLRRFKQIMETGEVVLSEATADGDSGLRQAPAQPREPAAAR